MALLSIQEPISITKIDDSSAKILEETNKIIVGIDFGTTNSLIGMVQENQVKLFADEQGKDLHASEVIFDKNGEFLLAGNKARNTTKSSEIKISSIKRLLGRGFAEVSSLNFSQKSLVENGLSSQNNNLKSALKLKIGQKFFYPAEISAFIFSHLLDSAEKSLSFRPSKAVISVPAYFDETAKAATKQAAKLAGLEVLRLISEPTAAAFAYGLDNQALGRFLVYDLGGGTFDVSVLKIENGVFRVIGVAGDNALGGDDFDAEISKIGFSNPKKVKEFLSFNEEFIEESKSLSRQDFERLVAKKIDESVLIVLNLLTDLKLSEGEIEGVIMVGGSTRIPFIKQKLAAIFGEKKILTNLDPDRVVAMGAAWQAFNLSPAKINSAQKNLLLDVNPLSLGIEMMGGIVEKIISRNSAIPCAKTKEFTTYADNQTAMKLHIVQGEREFACDCRSLAEFEIKKIPPMKAGLARVRVNFRLDVDGLLTVSAEEKITGEKQEIEIRPSFSLSESQIKEMLIQSLTNSKRDIQNRLLTEVIIEANHDLSIIETDLNDKNIVISDLDRQAISFHINKMKDLIAEKSSRDLIIQAQKQLTKLCETYILEKVNKILGQKVAGKKVENFE